MILDFGLFELPVNIDFLNLTFDLMKLTSSRNDATPYSVLGFTSFLPVSYSGAPLQPKVEINFAQVLMRTSLVLYQSFIGSVWNVVQRLVSRKA